MVVVGTLLSISRVRLTGLAMALRPLIVPLLWRIISLRLRRSFRLPVPKENAVGSISVLPSSFFFVFNIGGMCFYLVRLYIRCQRDCE